MDPFPWPQGEKTSGIEAEDVRKSPAGCRLGRAF